MSLRNVEDLLRERGIDISHETVRYWWNRFGLQSPRVKLAGMLQPGTMSLQQTEFQENRTAALNEWHQLFAAQGRGRFGEIETG